MTSLVVYELHVSTRKRSRLTFAPSPWTKHGDRLESTYQTLGLMPFKLVLYSSDGRLDVRGIERLHHVMSKSI